ncbi:hypothetical protein D3C76_1451170 [compost metagenome]
MRSLETTCVSPFVVIESEQGLAVALGQTLQLISRHFDDLSIMETVIPAPID